MARQVVLAISGSPSSKSRTALVAQHVLGLLGNENLETRFISARDLPAKALLLADTSDPAIAATLAAVEEASGIVFATPIFKAAYSGLLKCMLDILPQFALAGKAILPIATGGSVAHVLALDYGLRPVLQSMGARHIVQSHFIPEKDVTIEGERIILDPAAAVPLAEAVHHFKASLGLIAIDALMGHPRPVRPTLENSSIPFTDDVGARK
ncbi:MAG TPA: NADPH-dependent FMN reductase [Bradyrhizobium sp.]|jgi:FMN reductase|nr:NADPH-dependent FMN reductase [Bradyrhizobium sp.]